MSELISIPPTPPQIDNRDILLISLLEFILVKQNQTPELFQTICEYLHKSGIINNPTNYSMDTQNLRDIYLQFINRITSKQPTIDTIDTTKLIPYFEISKIDQDKPIPCYHHVGVYAYRRNVLNDYLYWSESHLEKLEGLEQLRFLSENKKIKCVEVSSRGNVFWELNNPEDVQRIEKVIS